MESTASRLEGCLCHSSQVHKKRRHPFRRSMMVQQAAGKPCIWQGRLGAWWVAVGFSDFLSSIHASRSNTFDRLVANLSYEGKSEILGQMQELKTKLVEVLQEKLRFWSFIPYKLLGVFWCTMGGSIDLCKENLRECIAQYEAAVADGHEGSLHRVARMGLSPDGIVGQQLRIFLTLDLPLKSSPGAFCFLQQYNFSSLVERRVEQLHSVVQRIGRRNTYFTTPVLCAHM